MTHRTRRRIAKAIKGPKVRSAPTKIREAKVISVSGSTATLEFNADTANPVSGVPIITGLVISAGQIVEVTFTGAAPLITRRIT